MSHKLFEKIWIVFECSLILTLGQGIKNHCEKKFQKFKNSPKSDPAGVGAITKAAGYA